MIILDVGTRATQGAARIGYILIVIPDHVVGHAGQACFEYVPAGVVFTCNY
jgi:hypothetical protein